MAEPNGISKIRQAGGIVALIGSIALGIFTLDSRYAKSAEFEKYVATTESSLKKIYVQQLRQEEREIVKTPLPKLTETEKRRLEDIRQEIKDLRDKK